MWYFVEADAVLMETIMVIKNNNRETLSSPNNRWSRKYRWLTALGECSFID